MKCRQWVVGAVCRPPDRVNIVQQPHKRHHSHRPSAEGEPVAAVQPEGSVRSRKHARVIFRFELCRRARTHLFVSYIYTSGSQAPFFRVDRLRHEIRPPRLHGPATYISTNVGISQAQPQLHAHHKELRDLLPNALTRLGRQLERQLCRTLVAVGSLAGLSGLSGFC